MAGEPQRADDEDYWNWENVNDLPYRIVEAFLLPVLVREACFNTGTDVKPVSITAERIGDSDFLSIYIVVNGPAHLWVRCKISKSKSKDKDVFWFNLSCDVLLDERIKFKQTWKIGSCSWRFANSFLYRTVTFILLAASLEHLRLSRGLTIDWDNIQIYFERVTAELIELAKHTILLTTECTTGLTESALFLIRLADRTALLHEAYTFKLTSDRELLVSPASLCVILLRKYDSGFALEEVQGIEGLLDIFAEHVTAQLNPDECKAEKVRQLCNDFYYANNRTATAHEVNEFASSVEVLQQEARTHKPDRNAFSRFITFIKNRYLGQDIDTTRNHNFLKEAVSILQSVLMYRSIDGRMKIDSNSNVSLNMHFEPEQETAPVSIRTHTRSYRIKDQEGFPLYFSRDVRFGDSESVPTYKKMNQDSKGSVVDLYENTIVSKGLTCGAGFRRVFYLLGPILGVILMIAGFAIKIFEANGKASPWSAIVLSLGSVISAVWGVIILAFGVYFRYVFTSSIHPRYILRCLTQHRSVKSLVSKRKSLGVFTSNSTGELEEMKALLSVVDVAYQKYPGQALLSGKCSYLDDAIRKNSGIEVDNPVKLKHLIESGHFVLYERNGLRLCHVDRDYYILCDKLLQRVDRMNTVNRSSRNSPSASLEMPRPSTETSPLLSQLVQADVPPEEDNLLIAVDREGHQHLNKWTLCNELNSFIG